MRFARRVVVTGIGMTTSFGNVPNTWSAILKGRSGISTLKDFDTSTLPCKFGGIIPNFKCNAFHSKHVNKMDLFVQYGMQAAQEAIEDAKLLTTSVDKKRVGVSIGSGMGGVNLIEKQYQRMQKARKQGVSRRGVSPFFIPGTIMNIISGVCAMEYKFQGPNFAVTSGCATGAHNIGVGASYIADGNAEIMIVGAAEKAVTLLNIEGFAACGALSRRRATPTTASCPWSTERDGFILSDGASVLVLESYEHAIKRGANIYGEVLGVGMSADAHHITDPEPNGAGAALAIQRALEQAKIDVTSVDYINAHATSTVQGDTAEIKAIASIWQEKITRVKISATKSMTGHLLGAAGSLEAAFCLLAIRDQVAPPTINLHTPAPQFKSLNLVPHYAQTGNIKTVLSNSFGFGGTNIALIFRQL